MKEKLNEGGYSVDNELVVKLQEDFRMKISDLSLVGNHNVANSLWQV